MQHFFRHTFRLYIRNPFYTIINVTGLAIGLAAGIAILAYIYGELSFDRFHINRHDIYRVNMTAVSPDGSFGSYTIPAAVGPSLKEQFPGIVSVTRITQPQKSFFETGGKIYEIAKVCYADSGFFRDFSFVLEEGDIATALSGIYSVVLTRSAARTLFGEAPALGKVLKMNNRDQFTVTGIAGDPPYNSSLQFDALISFSTLYQDKSLYMDWNGGNQYITFIRTQPGYLIAGLESALPAFLEEKINRSIRDSGWKYELGFEPLSNIHLRSLVDDGSGGNLSDIRIFSGIALLILLIACFNFTSLATARAMIRNRETGIRKVAGASRRMLIRQFMAEALVLSFTALLLALFIIELIRPWYSAVTGNPLSLYAAGGIPLMLMIVLLVVLTGLLAGAYPAFYLASFRPVDVLKGGSGSVKVRAMLPKALVVIQFAISAGLVASLLLMFGQISYINSFDKGYRSDNLLVVQVSDENDKNMPAFAGNSLGGLPFVESWTAVSSPPGAGVPANGYLPDGRNEAVIINVLGVDSGFLKTMGIEMLTGRNFSSGNDSMFYLVNESYARRYGVTPDKIHNIRRSGKHPVIGVVKDFSFLPVYAGVEPLILTTRPEEGFNALLIRVNTDLQTARTGLENEWQKHFPGEPFVCYPLDTYIADTYRRINRFAQLFSGFTILAIVVACMGLLGLSAVILQQRRRQFGIRRILGASPLSLTIRETAGFSLLVLTGNLLAIVPVWLFMSTWLAAFAYHINITAGVFLLTALITLLVAFLTIAWQSWSASKLNPVEVIKYE